MNEEYTITIKFDDVNSVNYAMNISPGITVEQLALVAAKLRFLANYAWTTNENMKSMQLAEQMEKQQKVAIAKPNILKPQ